MGIPMTSPDAHGRCALARLATLALLTLTLAVLAGPPAIAATAPEPAAPVETSAGDAVEWTAVPADADGPDGRVSLRHVVDPGGTVRDAIAVTNLGTGAAQFTVEAGDGIVGANGAFDISATDPADSGGWMTIDGLDDGRITLDAGEVRVLPLVIEVPDDATPGDHPAGIVVGISADSGGVTVTHRVGVRLHLQVTGDLLPALEIAAVRASYSPSWVPFAPGTMHVTYEVTNVGNVRLGAHSTVTGSGPFGRTAANASTELGELLPGGSATRSAELTVWPVLFVSGEVSVNALAVGQDVVALPPAVEHSFDVTAVPWSGLALLAAIAAALWIVRHRRRRGEPAHPGERVGEPEPENVASGV